MPGSCYANQVTNTALFFNLYHSPCMQKNLTKICILVLYVYEIFEMKNQ